MTDPLTYAKAGQTPSWWRIRVFDRDAGDFIEGVEECDADAGWLIRVKRGPDGRPYLDGDSLARERVEGRFALIRQRSIP